jgi:two-component sensor histidine kinase
MTPLRVLIVEDSKDHADVLLHYLRYGGYQVVTERVESAEGMTAALDGRVWDAVICDHMLPNFSSFEALAILQQRGLDLPFILVSGAIGEETAVAIMKAGAHDYIPKTNFPRLLPVLERELQQAAVRRERRQAQAALVEEHARLKAALAEREVLLREVHHRVKNNLQIVGSLLDLQAGLVADQSAREALAQTKQRMEAIARVHEQLYQSPELGRIEMAGYLQSLLSDLRHAYGAAAPALQVQVAEVVLAIDAAIPCGLIVNELVTNAFKYAFPNGRPGAVDIRLAQEGAECQLEVSDNGIGLPPGFELDGSPALGLRLVKLLVGQLRGTWEVQREKGTGFRIKFPAPK